MLAPGRRAERLTRKLPPPKALRYKADARGAEVSDVATVMTQAFEYVRSSRAALLAAPLLLTAGQPLDADLGAGP